MARQEYRIVAAPVRARRKAPGSDDTARYVSTLEEEVNRMAAAGWTFLRTETMPHQRRRGLFRKVEETVSTLLVFSRETGISDAVRGDDEAFQTQDQGQRPRPIGPALRARREQSRTERPKLVGAAHRDRDEPDPA